MTKQEQFLMIVQTAVLANGINLASRPDSNEAYRHAFSATGALTVMDEAIDASERIPEGMTAFEAAHEFCNCMLANLRDDNERGGSKVSVPDWFAR